MSVFVSLYPSSSCCDVQCCLRLRESLLTCFDILQSLVCHDCGWCVVLTGAALRAAEKFEEAELKSRRCGLLWVCCKLDTGLSVARVVWF